MFFKSSIKDINAEVCDATGDATLPHSWAHKKIYLLLIIICCSLKVAAQYAFTITFKNMVGNQPLHTDSTYTNQFGEPFKIRNCRYYISNIILIDSLNNKSQYFNDQYFLVDEKEEGSKHIELTTSLKHITCIEFLLGIDSIKNVSGVQTGALDPAKGMFWTWNTGYVMAKIEGTSPVAKTPGHAFSYHVGGYKAGEAVAKRIKLPLQQINSTSNQIIIAADILQWFKNKYDIKIADIAFCHEPGNLAMHLAGNYANMFSIEKTR